MTQTEFYFSKWCFQSTKSDFSSAPLEQWQIPSESQAEPEAQRKDLPSPLPHNEFAGESHLLHEIEQMVPSYLLKCVPHPMPETHPGIALPVFPNALPGVGEEAVRKFEASVASNPFWCCVYRSSERYPKAAFKEIEVLTLLAGESGGRRPLT